MWIRKKYAFCRNATEKNLLKSHWTLNYVMLTKEFIDYCSLANTAPVSIVFLTTRYVQFWKNQSQGNANHLTFLFYHEFSNSEVFYVDKWNNYITSVPYPEFFWAYRYMYQNWDFNEIIGECNVRPTKVMALFSWFSMPNN